MTKELAELKLQSKETATENASSKLCLEVIESNWAKKTGGTQSQFENAVIDQLHLSGKSHEQIAAVYENRLLQQEIQAHGILAGNKIMDIAKENWKCK